MARLAILNVLATGRKADFCEAKAQGETQATNQNMKCNMSAAVALALAMLSGGAAAQGFGGWRLGGAGAGAPTFRGHQFASHARLSLSQARAAALKARPGALVDQELEKELGGSGLRYSFDVLSGGKIYEVGVDAKTGKILENDIESAAEGAAEH
jgi:uncharacterized membrane protein YkoI